LNKVTPIYDYNSTQMNVPNKLFKWMEVEINYVIRNEDRKVLIESKKFPFRLKEENYVTFLYGKMKKVKNIQFDDFDHLKVELEFYSKKVDLAIKSEIIIFKKDILDKCEKTRVFNF